MVRCVAEWTSEEGVRLHHPNREKGANKATKAVIVLLILVSVVLMLIVTIGGWAKLEGAIPVQIGYIIIYALLAFFIARWNRGALPLVAALAILLGIFAAIAGPGWFERDKTGFEDPALSADFLGLITLLIVPVQVLLIAFAMRGFQQSWNVEEEKHDAQGGYQPQPQPAT
jgi:presenilin-like A22 family membrane protease